MAIDTFTAVEQKGLIEKAMGDWRTKLEAGSIKIEDGFSWIRRLGMWWTVRFRESDQQYWNSFGLSSSPQMAGGIKAEINPPPSGINRRFTGILAIGPDKKRWLLHRGRLRLSTSTIGVETFDRYYRRPRVPVVFSDGKTLAYHPVVTIDDDSDRVQNAVHAFVVACSNIRQSSLNEDSLEQILARIERIETLNLELLGTYYIPPRDESVGNRVHAEVSRALIQALDGIGVRSSNRRFGNWGPDLWTLGDASFLFEIKTETTSSDLQRAVGQLLLYEQLSQRTFNKVLVLPKQLSERLGEAACNLGISILTYTRELDKISVDLGCLQALLA